MGEISAETLMAFADGELDPAEHARVEKIIATRPDLQVRLAAFTATGKVLATKFRKRLDEPLPPHLVDLVLNAATRHPPPSSPADADSRKSEVWSRLKEKVSFEMPAWPVALALSAALLIGVAVGWHLGQARSADGLIALERSVVVATSELARALERAPSGASSTVAAGTRAASTTSVSIRLTFKSHEEYCRQFQLMAPTGESTSGIACRNSTGEWLIRTYAASPAVRSSDGRTKPAGSGSSAALATIIDNMIEGDALGVEEESGLIARRWQR